MMQQHDYDVVVIGSGPSGRTVSLRYAKKFLYTLMLHAILLKMSQIRKVP